MTSTRLLFLALLVFGATTIAEAQKYSNEFLSIGVGARAQAMGNAVIASTNDVYAGVWNPAGLAALTPDDGLQLGAMHSEWFGGVGNYDYLSFSLPTTQGGNRLGFSLVRFGIDQIPNTLSLYESDGSINFDNLSEFSSVDYAFLGSYAKEINKGKGPIRFGGSVKVVLLLPPGVLVRTLVYRLYATSGFGPYWLKTLPPLSMPGAFHSPRKKKTSWN